jgi:methylaspartate ammonia-lyase
MSRTLEENYIRNIENAIRGIRLNTKTPQDVGATVSSNMEKLKKVNDGMADELMKKYNNVVEDYKKRKK